MKYGDDMNRQRKKEIIQLGQYMNEKSLIKIPLINHIINSFDLLIDDQQLHYLLKLNNQKRSYEQLKELYDGDDFETFIHPLLHYGLIWCLHDEYELAPIFPGWIEICLSGPMDDKKMRVLNEFKNFEEFLKLVNLPGIRQYLNYSHKKTLKNEPARMSTYVVPQDTVQIPIHKKIESKQEIILEGDVYQLLKDHPDEIAVMNCMCRLIKETQNHQCEFDMPMRACLCVGSFSNQIMKYNVGEKISLEDAIALVDECSKKGAVHTIYHYGMNSNNEEIAICNCCKDCCFVYGSVQDGAISNIHIKAHYLSSIHNQKACIHCKQCLKYCPTDALSFNKNEITIDKSRCIGCGQCAKRCPKHIFEMIYGSRNVYVKTKGKRFYENRFK